MALCDELEARIVKRQEVQAKLLEAVVAGMANQLIDAIPADDAWDLDAVADRFTATFGCDRTAALVFLAAWGTWGRRRGTRDDQRSACHPFPDAGAQRP